MYIAQVAELVDAPGSGPGGVKTVEVRVLSWAPNQSISSEFRIIVSFRSGPVEIISMGTSQNFSKVSTNFFAFVGSSSNLVMPRVDFDHPGNCSKIGLQLDITLSPIGNSDIFSPLKS
tara:strand:+ start:219 stop:572 length:354 start_codon:yes stop_codon:yes gene_type:complete